MEANYEYLVIVDLLVIDYMQLQELYALSKEVYSYPGFNRINIIMIFLKFPMKKLSILFFIAGASLFNSPTFAQENSQAKDTTKGVYVTAGVGGSWSSSPNINYNESGTGSVPTILGIPFNANLNGTANLGGGIAAEGGLGYDFGNNIRTELTYVLNTFDSGKFSASGNIAIAGANLPLTGRFLPSGNVVSNSVFVSGYYDFPTKSKFTPYVGAGLGYTSVNLPSEPATFTSAIASGSKNIDSGSASSFGYLAKLGVSYAAAKSTDIYVEGIYQGNTGVTINEVQVDPLNTFSARAGLRFRFGS